MIESHEIGAPKTRDPFDKSVDQMLDWPTRFTANQLDEITNLLRRLINDSERAREKQAPTVVNLSPSSGSPIARTYSTKTRLRVIGFVLSGGVAADQFALNIGTFTYYFYNNAGPVWVPFPIEIDVGIDLSAADITTPANTAWSFYLIGYTE